MHTTITSPRDDVLCSNEFINSKACETWNHLELDQGPRMTRITTCLGCTSRSTDRAHLGITDNIGIDVLMTFFFSRQLVN